jgi:hypothetical protein
MCLLLLLLSCTAKNPTPPADPSPLVSPEPAESENLPTPFTAEEIREAFRPGQHLVFTIFTAGKGTVVSDWTVTGWTDQEATIGFTTLAEDGETVLEPTEERTTPWAELRDHASFPAATATRSQGVLIHPLGTLDIWLYSVSGPDEGMTQRYWFAKDLPGPPIRFTITAGGEEVFRMEQVVRSTADDP